MDSGVMEVEGTMGLADGDSEWAGSAPPRLAHNIMDVLMPATPPTPVNARVIRRFDLEAGAKEHARRASGSMFKAARKEQRRRSVSREERNQSLLKAAGFARD